MAMWPLHPGLLIRLSVAKETRSIYDNGQVIPGY